MQDLLDAVEEKEDNWPETNLNDGVDDIFYDFD